MCAFHGWQLRQLPLQAQVKVLADANRDLAAALQESTHEFSAERPGLAESERQERGQEVECEREGERGEGGAREGESGGGRANSGGAGSQTRKSEGEGGEGLREEKGGDSGQRTEGGGRRESASGRGSTGEGMRGERNSPQNKDNKTVLERSIAPSSDAGETGKALLELHELGQVCVWVVLDVQ